MSSKTKIVNLIMVCVFPILNNFVQGEEGGKKKKNVLHNLVTVPKKTVDGMQRSESIISIFVLFRRNP